MNKLNPEVREIQIGIREFESLKIYPLSIADQMSMSELITESLRKFFGVEGADGQGEAEQKSLSSVSDVEFVEFLVKLITENLAVALNLITDAGTLPQAKKLLQKITNNQAVEIATIVYEMNYQDSAKNLMSLLGKVMPALQSRRPLQPSSNDTPDMGLNTSSDSVSEKED